MLPQHFTFLICVCVILYLYDKVFFSLCFSFFCVKYLVILPVPCFTISKCSCHLLKYIYPRMVSFLLCILPVHSLPVLQWSDLCWHAPLHSTSLGRSVYCWFSASCLHAPCSLHPHLSKPLIYLRTEVMWSLIKKGIYNFFMYILKCFALHFYFKLNELFYNLNVHI